MKYTEAQIKDFKNNYMEVSLGLQDLMLKTALAGQEAVDAKVKDHLVHGAGRRLSIIKKCLENIFTKFPPTTTKPLDKEVLYDIQINLHAYVMNLSGIFDNWAWAFIFRHNLLSKVGGKHGVDLFNKRTTKFFPEQFRNYLSSEKITAWHEKYLKSYRDALAHRIPLYIPPAEFTPEEAERYNQLENEKMNFIKTMEFQKHDELSKEQETIGNPSFSFMHSYEEETANPILFHPQLLCDGLLLIECGTLYMDNWNEII